MIISNLCVISLHIFYCLQSGFSFKCKKALKFQGTKLFRNSQYLLGKPTIFEELGCNPITEEISEELLFPSNPCPRNKEEVTNISEELCTRNVLYRGKSSLENLNFSEQQWFLGNFLSESSCFLVVLSSWKAKQLSVASRLTLLNSMIKGLPSYDM